MKARFASLIILSLIAAIRLDAACPNNTQTPVNIGAGQGGFEVLCGPTNPHIRVVGNPGPIVFVGVGGGGAGGSAGGSGFAGNDRNDNGGGAGGGAGAPILVTQIATATGDTFEIVIGSGGQAPASGGSMGTPGTAGGDGLSSIVRRSAGLNLVEFPGAQGGRGGIGSTHQPAAAPGGAPMAGGTQGGNGGAESRAGDPGGLSSILPASCGMAPGGSTSADHGGGGGGGGSALCVGGKGGSGGSSQGSAGQPGVSGQFGSGGGGAGARGAGGEVGAGGGNGGNGLVIVFWGNQARDFPIATDRPSSMSEAGMRRVQDALRTQATRSQAFRALCPCVSP